MDVVNINPSELGQESSSVCSSDATVETVAVEGSLVNETAKDLSTSPAKSEVEPAEKSEESKPREPELDKPEIEKESPADSISESSSEESSENGPLSPTKAQEVAQSILDAQKLVDSLSRSLSKAKEDNCGDSDAATMVLGNRRELLATHHINSENIAKYFTMPMVDNNLKVALALGNSINLKCPLPLQRKENHFQRYDNENRSTTSESNNSDDESSDLLDDNHEDWSFDEDDDEVEPGKECPCAFKNGGDENEPKTPLRRQDSNLDSPSTSNSPLLNNPFFVAPSVLQCPDCDQSFNCRVDLNRHRLKHIKDKSFKCSHCSKSFAFSFNLKSHERQHTGEKPYVCTECGLSFIHAFNFHEHRRVHNTRSHYVCSICMKWFNVEAKYLLHIRKHSSIKPYKCRTCGKLFQRAAGFRAHELLHAVTSEDQKYACRFCPRSFVHLNSKQMHEKVHFGQKLFPCMRCGSAFNDLSVLKSHHCIAQFKCPVCAEVFQSLPLLEAHAKTHSAKKLATRNAPEIQSKFNLFKKRTPLMSNKKRFPCNLCSQSFSTKRLLDDHGKIHKREYTPFMCKVCSLTFTHSNYLKLHLTTHEGETDAQRKMQVDAKALPQTLNISPYSSPRSRQNSGDQSICSSPLNKTPPFRIKSEPE